MDRTAAIAGRLTRVWRALPSERRLAAAAAIGLFATLFLPWYQETVIARGVTSLRSLSDSLTGWGAFSFVEAAVLLVAAGVLLLLFARAEGEAFHVPGGDGGVITAAGAWACVLIIWRMFDKEGTTGHGLYTTSSGIEWGIFVALAVAGLLAYSGTRIRLAHEPEPPLPGERPRRGRGRGLRGRRGDRTDSVSSRPRSTPVEQQDWAAADEIEEMWLELEGDRPRSTASPPHNATVPFRARRHGSTCCPRRHGSTCCPRRHGSTCCPRRHGSTCCPRRDTSPSTAGCRARSAAPSPESRRAGGAVPRGSGNGTARPP